MREIIYRCWDDDLERFAYSSDMSDEYIWEFNGCSLVCEVYSEICDSCGFEKTIWESLTSDVEQYTGFDDKNGVRIFEGDILKLDRGYIPCGCRSAKAQDVLVSVVYKNGSFDTDWFEVQSGHEKGSKARLPLLYYFRNFEVVGNIHQTGDTI